MEPRVAVADFPIHSPDGTFEIERDSFPQFSVFERVGVHVQSGRVQIAHPEPEYVESALAALARACRELGVPEASIVFVDTVVPPPDRGLRYGFKGGFTTDYPTLIWLEETVRHEAAHLAFARTHTAEESAGHSGPSEDFAIAFERSKAP